MRIYADSWLIEQQQRGIGAQGAGDLHQALGDTRELLLATREDRRQGRHAVTEAGPGGGPISYAAFIAPGLLAASAMNGAVFDSTFNVFFKLKYNRLYDAVLATPLGPFDIALGEIAWALIRGGMYALAFLAVLDAAARLAKDRLLGAERVVRTALERFVEIGVVGVDGLVP